MTGSCSASAPAARAGDYSRSIPLMYCSVLAADDEGLAQPPGQRGRASSKLMMSENTGRGSTLPSVSSASTAGMLGRTSGCPVEKRHVLHEHGIQWGAAQVRWSYVTAMGGCLCQTHCPVLVYARWRWSPPTVKRPPPLSRRRLAGRIRSTIQGSESSG